MKVWTSLIRYEGQDRLDVSRKGNDCIGKYFAPSWDLLHAFKAGKMTQEQYTRAYLAEMRDSYRKYRKIWEGVLACDEKTFCCYEKAGDFCHRRILAQDIFAKLGATYMGER